MKKPTQAKLPYLRFVLPLLATLSLVGCGLGTVEDKETCAEQTQQFSDDIHSLVVDELTPVIENGLSLGPNAEVMRKIEQLIARTSELATLECNPRTQAVKDALLLYMMETRNYFSTVAGRAVYGEGPVQAQQSKMYEAGLAFEIAFENLRK